MISSAVTYEELEIVSMDPVVLWKPDEEEVGRQICCGGMAGMAGGSGEQGVWWGG